MKNMQLMETIPAGKNPYGWTDQRLYKTDEGYVQCMAVSNARQNTIDYQTVAHVSVAQAEKFIQEARTRAE